MPTNEALRMAYDQDLDLVEVAPNVRPPVCRIMDYGKWKYQQKKGQKKHHEQELKEVRLRPKTDTHDLSIKTKHALDFLRDGDKVQFTMVFRGRERAHREVGMETFQQILAELGERAKVERPPIMDGRNLIMIIVPGKIEKEASGDGKGDAARAEPARSEPRKERSDPSEPAKFGSSLNIPQPASSAPPAAEAPNPPHA